MRALFDVNVLIALLDEQHTQHHRAQNWWSINSDSGWASCPLTQNGYVRIMSQPGYQQPITVAFALNFLAQQITDGDHQFWPDDISLLDAEFFDRDGILGPRQITDVYLLALAAKHGGRLVTMDTAIPHAAARRAGPEHLVVI